MDWWYTSAISLIAASDFNTVSMCEGIESNSFIKCAYSESAIVAFSLASFKAIKVSTVIWVVKAFVEATPISGPAWVYAPACVSRAIDEPTTLHTPKTKAPRLFAILIAARVSAVSPD